MSHVDRVRELLGTGEVAQQRDLIAAGVPSVSLTRMVKRGLLEKIEGPNGILIGYRLPIEQNAPDMLHGKLAEIVARHPGAVICLDSALRLHGMTDDLERKDCAAVGFGANRHSNVPQLRLIRWSNPLMLTLGVAGYTAAGLPVRATDPARTVADLFRPENSYGADDRQAGVSFLARHSGAEGLERAASYAMKLGWYGEIAPSLGTAKEMLQWQEAPKP